MASKLEEVKKLDEITSNLVTSESGKKYREDDRLMGLQTIIGSLSRRIELLLSADTDNEVMDDVNESFELVLENYLLFNLRKAIIDGNVNIPLEVGQLKDIRKLIEVLADQPSRTILFFGKLPGTESGKSLETGSGVKIHIIPDDFLQKFIKNAEMDRYPVDSIALCSKVTPSNCIKYLLLTGKLNLPTEDVDRIIELGILADKNPELKELALKGDIAAIEDWIKKKS